MSLFLFLQWCHYSCNITFFFFIEGHPQKCDHMFSCKSTVQNWSLTESGVVLPAQHCFNLRKKVSGTGTKKDQILAAIKLKPAASCMHRNSPTFHYVKVQQRNVLCLLLTCAAAANHHRSIPNSTRLMYVFIYLFYGGNQETVTTAAAAAAALGRTQDARQTQTTLEAK